MSDESKVQTPANGEVTARSPKSWRDELKYWFELAGIMSAIVGVVFLVAQYGQMVKTTRATLDAVKVSSEQAKLMKRQLDDSEAQQRAMVNIERWDVNRRTAEPKTAEHEELYSVYFSTIVKNHGPTPALNVQAIGLSWRDGQSTNRTVNQVIMGNGLSIMPGVTTTDIFMSGPWVVGQDFRFETQISYRDIFGKPQTERRSGTYYYSNGSFIPDATIIETSSRSDDAK